MIWFSQNKNIKKKNMETKEKLCYNLSVTASKTGDRKEVGRVEILISLIVAVAAGVICHYIIKWLDSDK